MRYSKRVGDPEKRMGFSGSSIFKFSDDEFRLDVSRGMNNVYPQKEHGFWVTYSQGDLSLDAQVYDSDAAQYDKVLTLVRDEDAYGLRLFMIDLFANEAPLIWRSLYEAGTKEGRRQLQAELRGLLGLVER